MPRSDAVFSGRIPEIYDRFMGPLLFEPYAAEVVPRLAWLRAGHLLETAAGTGIVTQALAAALPPAVAITATDLNAAMLEQARTRLGTGRVTLRQADAQRLPFDDASFDAVVCQFGVMFMPEKHTAYAEALRVLKPEGRFLFSVWTEIARSPIADTVQAAVADLFPTDQPLFMARTPHGYHDLPAITAALAEAGFDEVRAETRTLTCRSPSSRHAATAICEGTPLRSEIEAREGPDLATVTDIAAHRLADRFGRGEPDAPISAPMEAIFVSGVRPV